MLIEEVIRPYGPISYARRSKVIPNKQEQEIAVMSFPLQDAKLCVDCDFVFASGGNTCVKCGSESSWVWIGRYIQSLKGDNHERISKDSSANNDVGRSRI